VSWVTQVVRWAGDAALGERLKNERGLAFFSLSQASVTGVGFNRSAPFFVGQRNP
jgi:hypothetical protein